MVGHLFITCKVLGSIPCMREVEGKEAGREGTLDKAMGGWRSGIEEGEGPEGR